MKSFISHIQINIDQKNLDFYKKLMDLLGMTLIMEDASFAGYTGSNNASVWFVPAIKNVEGDYDTKGFNHLGFNAASIKEVDDVVSWLSNNKIKSLFGTPKHRPDFAGGEKETYYQVMFESPDKVLFEVVYVGKK